jgi:hypothetical protein
MSKLHRSDCHFASVIRPMVNQLKERARRMRRDTYALYLQAAIIGHHGMPSWSRPC